MDAAQRTPALVRAAAARVVDQVLSHGRYLDAALDDLRRTQQVVASDWPLLQELCYGTLRWYHQLAGIASLLLRRPLKAKDRELHALMLVGLYQVRHTRVATHAAVDATVAAAEVLRKTWAKGLINACLRASLREEARVEQALGESTELRYSHPAWLIAAIGGAYPEKWQGVLGANHQRPPLTLRVNGTRIARADYQKLLQAHGLRARPHPEVDSALVLDDAIPAEQLPGFGAGLVSVQDAAAQLAAVWLDAGPRQRVLDACAAPGGKTAHILERVPTLEEMTALDIDPARLRRVQANLARLGLGAKLLVADAAQPPQWWDGRPYDRILVDAPCSATGVIRRHPDIKVRRRPEELALLVKTQAEILAAVWPCLAPGGKLLYATCSVLNEENELQVQEFLRRRPDAVAQPLVPGARTVGRQILPGEEEMDGFYYAYLAKT